MMKYAMVAIVAGALVLAASPGIAQDVSQPYVGGIGDYTASCETNDVVGYCAGGAIFTGLPSGSHGILLADDALAPVGGAFSGDGAPQEDFCGSTQLPASFAGGDLVVWVDGPIYGSGLGVFGMTCPDVQLGTTGSVHLCFNRAC